MPVAAKLSLLAVGFAVFAAAGGPVAAQLGLLPPYTAFRTFALGTFTGSLLAVGCGLWVLLRTWNQPEALGRPWAWAGLLVGAALLLAMALAGASAAKVPPIHDVTTDPEDPPSFLLAREAEANRGRDLSYPHGDPKSADRQRKAYPDLGPVLLDDAPVRAFDAALAAIRRLGWTVTASEAPGANTSGRIEATQTTRLFRFVDDIAVRIRPQADGTGSVVDLRSTSRNGISDLGANAQRIRQFCEELSRGELPGGEEASR